MRATRVGRDTRARLDRRAGRSGPRARRRRSSGWPTGSARSSCRSCWSCAAAHVRDLVAARPGAAADARADRVHRVRRHRLPVRDGPRHADGDHGRHRPRRRRPASWSAARRRSRRAGQVDAVVFDKTGTLTLGRPTVDAIVVAPGLRRARGDRPGGVGGAGQRAPARPRRSWSAPTATSSGFRRVEGFEAIAGRGVTRRVDGRRGARRHAAAAGGARGRVAIARSTAECRRSAGADAGLRRHRRPARRRRSSIADPMRAEAAEAVARRCARRASRSGCVSGDHRPTVDAVAARRSASPPSARSGGMLPADKAAIVARAAGRRPRAWRWSATASTTRRRWPRPTSASPSARGTDVAVEASDVTLVGGDPRLVRPALALSRADDARSSARTCSGRSPTTSC